MRVQLDTGTLTVAPGAVTNLTVEVFNESGVIEGVSARVMGLDAQWVRARPSRLALFPDTAGEIALRIEVPPEFPAGVHSLAVEVASSVPPVDIVVVPFELEVRPATDALVELEPSRLSGRAQGTFLATVVNSGNVPLEVALLAADDERALQFRFDPVVVTVPAGHAVTSRVLVRARRRPFGSTIDRSFEVTASTRDAEYATNGVFAHQPLIPRGVLTALMLLAIVAVWAGVFLVVLGTILDKDGADKATPASFFATSAEVLEAAGGDAGSAAGAGAGADGAKIDARATGGSVAGVVRAANNQEPVGRITVDAVRITRDGPETAGSSATDDEGAYEIGALPPGTYVIRYSAPGFEEVWYPDAPSVGAAERFRVGALEESDGRDVAIEGLPGSIAGVVDTGGLPGEVPVRIAVRPVVGGVPGAEIPTASTGTDAANAFTASALPTPALYELTFTAEGYQPTTQVARLGGGEDRLTATVRLSAGEGSISGLVTDGNVALGGVTVTARSGDVDLTTATPTSGAVGRFDLGGLPTPGTYLLTFSREGYGAETVAVELGPGERRADLDVVLTRGTGAISGRVTSATGGGLGDVTVTVSGNGVTTNTSTLTAGGIGSYAVGSLSTPGRYTLTFSREGFADATLAVDLGPSGLASGVDVALAPTTATIRGNVSDECSTTGIGGVQITATNGEVDVSTEAASGPAGDYILTALVPGSYAITFSAQGFETETILVSVDPGAALTRDVQLGLACP
jgi:hypothetical protein